MQSGHAHLREYLSQNGFVIIKEALAKEGAKMYTALLAVRGENYSLSQTQMEIGPYLINERPPLFPEYIRYRLYEIDTVLKNISSSESAQERKNHYLRLKEEYEKLLEA
jgi:tRNA (adenine22-N1)-methyltransferase